MTPKEKILVAIMAILVVLVVILGYKASQVNYQIGVKEAALNQLHQERIEAYNNQIATLLEKVTTLQAENDSLNELKQQVKIVTIREVDSVRALPFDEQSNFWAREVSRLDSIQSRYLSSNN